MHLVYKGDRVMNALQDLIKTYASQYKEQVVEWRRHIHSHPELSGEKKIHLYLFKRCLVN